MIQLEFNEGCMKDSSRDRRGKFNLFDPLLFKDQMCQTVSDGPANLKKKQNNGETNNRKKSKN